MYMYMGVCTWEAVHGRLYMGGCTWEDVLEIKSALRIHAHALTDETEGYYGRYIN